MTASGESATCEHCDGSLPHRHGPGPGADDVVRAPRRALAAWAGIRAALLLVAALVLASVLTGRRGAGPPAALLLLLGAGAWTVATVTGLLVAGSLHRPQRESTARPAFAVGAVAAAAVTPLPALAVVLATGPHPWWPVAVGAGTGWLAAALAADVVAALRLRTLLHARDRRGEQARGLVGGSAAQARQLAGSVGGAVAFTASTAALGILPVLVVVLVPLSAAVAAYVAQARMPSTGMPRDARLRG